MSEFGDNFDQDPAAEFLQREQSALADLEDNNTAPVPENEAFGVGSTLESSGSFEMINSAENQGYGDNVNGNNDDFSNMNVASKEIKEEPEKIKRWREDQKQRLEEKDVEEEKKKEELRKQAAKELEDWYKHHEETIAKTKSTNRNAEKQVVADDDEIEPGTEWERIAKLCDFNPKTNKASRDVSRMRSIILQLKQQPLSKTKA